MRGLMASCNSPPKCKSIFDTLLPLLFSEMDFMSILEGNKTSEMYETEEERPFTEPPDVLSLLKLRATKLEAGVTVYRILEWKRLPRWRKVDKVLEV